MSNKRDLKRIINYITSDLFAECMAASLYGTNSNSEEINALLSSIVTIRDNYIRRISHIEPGMPVKLYFKDLKEKLNKETNEIIDHINNLY
ncbi:hypothetical protein HMPREF1860_00284 [Prevotella amnii]|jgi:hypothetical protein|uniref:Uncharacterized protein n=2 Tax=Prevotella amnii TaxID=419005 RepID=A0A134BL03_9BACT|nr:hypothetical protein [Prevotella amnii]EFN91546.1 hypothetical protein HMPREF9018_0578 [Prevotella amnii CRIS 21A-A]KXB80605.1 hypothetical protein HMPREF1860_00284 [Prevotella amnii]